MTEGQEQDAAKSGFWSDMHLFLKKMRLFYAFFDVLPLLKM